MAMHGGTMILLHRERRVSFLKKMLRVSSALWYASDLTFSIYSTTKIADCVRLPDTVINTINDRHLQCLRTTVYVTYFRIFEGIRVPGNSQAHAPTDIEQAMLVAQPRLH